MRERGSEMYRPLPVSPERVMEFVGALQAGNPPWDYQHFLGGGCLAVCNPDELAGIIDYLASDNAIEKAAVQIRDNQIRGLNETVEILRRHLENRKESKPVQPFFKTATQTLAALLFLSFMVVALLGMAWVAFKIVMAILTGLS